MRALFCFLVIFTASLSEGRPPPPLFQAGAERFQVQDERGQTPTFRLLEGSSRKRAIAFAINAALRAQPDADKAGPSSNYVEARVERLTLAPDRKNPSRLRLTVTVSGQAIALREDVSRADFEAGKKIAFRLKTQSTEAPPITIESSGHLTMTWLPASDAIEIARAVVDFVLIAPLADDITETIEFRGRAVRE